MYIQRDTRKYNKTGGCAELGRKCWWMGRLFSFFSCPVCPSVLLYFRTSCLCLVVCTAYGTYKHLFMLRLSLESKYYRTGASMHVKGTWNLLPVLSSLCDLVWLQRFEAKFNIAKMKVRDLQYCRATFQWSCDIPVGHPLAPKRNVFVKNGINNFCSHPKYDQKLLLRFFTKTLRFLARCKNVLCC